MQKVRTPVLIQRLPARFNAGQVRAIMQELQPFLKADRPRVVFDLSQVEEMDAASVDMLLQCMSDANAFSTSTRHLTRGMAPHVSIC